MQWLRVQCQSADKALKRDECIYCSGECSDHHVNGARC
jgi:hypothetical protein